MTQRSTTTANSGTQKQGPVSTSPRSSRTENGVSVLSFRTENTEFSNALKFLKFLCVQRWRHGYILAITLACPGFVTSVISADRSAAKLEKEHASPRAH